MVTPAGGGAGKIGVVGSEQLFGGCVGWELHQPAVGTHKHLEGICDLRPQQLLRSEIGVAGRLVAQVDYLLAKG